MIEAKDLDSAFKLLVEKATEGLLTKLEGVGFYQSEKVQITYEEVTDGTSKISAGEVKPGTPMGQESYDVTT
ncbi:MAG: hypothetical protein QF855_01885 [Candidatus Pacebacteria bacterium]|nr:hypothetical protein [Candidatus Paceibacterota bacterium]